MTSTRVIRGTKAKIFLYVCAILIITGLIACYNNTLFQLDEIKKSNDVCHQQEENLSTQLQVISDYKQRLEKSLKTEKAEHQQTKTTLESKLNEEKSRNEKLSSDSVLKYNSLQQHFNLLQTQHDDFKDEASKTQQKQLEEINNLQSKLSEVQEQLKKVQSSKENLKTENMELRSERESLKKALVDKDGSKTANELAIADEYRRLKEEFIAYKETCKAELPNNILLSPEMVKKASPIPSNVSPADKEKNLPPNLASPNKISSVSMSSTPKSLIKPSKGVLNGARPIWGPSMTPETIVGGIKERSKLEEKKDSQIEPELVNNRYQNQIDKGKEEADKDTGAHEEFDVPLGQNNINALDGLGFGDNEAAKQGDKPNFDKRHIDQLGNLGLEKDKNKQYDQEYKEHDVQLEQEGDDDADADYVDRDNAARQQDPAVRD